MRIDRKQSGMTMMELLAVLVIIGIVMGVVGGKFFGQAEEAKRKAAKIEINQIGQSLDLFKLEVGRYPTTSEGLQALIIAPAGVPTGTDRTGRTARCRRTRGRTSTSTRRPDSMAPTTSCPWARTARKAATAPIATSRAGTEQ